MEDENNLVRVESESGEFLDMLILKEFDYKKKKYAVLMEMDSCHCGSDCDCDCDDDCDCGCKEGKECTCEGECKEDDCHCKEDCECDDCECGEKALCILEITKDKDGNEVFVSIDDEKLYDEVINEADKVLYED